MKRCWISFKKIFFPEKCYQPSETLRLRRPEARLRLQRRFAHATDPSEGRTSGEVAPWWRLLSVKSLLILRGPASRATPCPTDPGSNPSRRTAGMDLRTTSLP